MKNNKKIISIILLLVIITLIAGIIYKGQHQNKKEGNFKTTDDITMQINTDDGDEDIDLEKLQKKEITLTESLTIKEEGIYTLTGIITDGYIKINTSGNVKLILNNVNIKNSSGPAIIIEQSNNTIIYLEENSENNLEDGSKYIGYDEDVDAVIYSKDDLIFDGPGNLKIKSYYQDGICSKDDLKIINGNYDITSVDDGIKGKDSVYIIDGTFNIKSGGDALKSTNSTNIEKGYILIKNATFNIESELDGIQAETKLLISNGVFNIKTGGGSINSSTSSNWGNWGSSNNQNTNSAKGIKAKDNIVIENGTFNLDTSDDAIHSNNYVGIKDGVFNIQTGDDGIHADTQLIIDNGTIDISKSYEGIESAKIIINNGKINIISNDDGINVAGGKDSSSMGRPGQNNYSTNTDQTLTITDGVITISSEGDGIDINGNGYIKGGTITINGPENNANAALDYDGELVITGGTLIAIGSSGMAQSISSSSIQYGVLINFTSNYEKGTKISIVDSNENIITSYTSTKKFSSFMFSNSKLSKNTTYTIKINNETYKTFTPSQTSTTVGSSMGGPGRR